MPWLLIVPNHADTLMTVEPDGRHKRFDGLLKAAGYSLAVKEHVFADEALREIMGVTDSFLLFRHAETA